MLNVISYLYYLFTTALLIINWLHYFVQVAVPAINPSVSAVLGESVEPCTTSVQFAICLIIFFLLGIACLYIMMYVNTGLIWSINRSIIEKEKITYYRVIVKRSF